MEENNFLKKILSESNSQPKSSLSDQMSQMIANTPKEPLLPDILEKAMNSRAIKNDFIPIEQNKEIYKPSNPPRNSKYVANDKNFVKLVDRTDAHESKITDLEDTQAFFQNEITKINTVLKKHENDLSHKVSVSSQLQSSDKSQTSLEGFFLYFAKDIHWKSFAGGVLILAIILFFFYQKL